MRTRALSLQEMGWVAGGTIIESNGKPAVSTTGDLTDSNAVDEGEITVSATATDTSAATTANNKAMSNVLGGCAAGAIAGGISASFGGPVGSFGGAALGCVAGMVGGAAKSTVDMALSYTN